MLCALCAPTLEPPGLAKLGGLRSGPGGPAAGRKAQEGGGRQAEAQGRPSPATQLLANDSLCITHQRPELGQQPAPSPACPCRLLPLELEAAGPRQGRAHSGTRAPRPCPRPGLRRPPWGGAGRAVPEGPEEVKPPTSAQEIGGETAGGGGHFAMQPLQGCTLVEGPSPAVIRSGGSTRQPGVRQPGPLLLCCSSH